MLRSCKHCVIKYLWSCIVFSVRKCFGTEIWWRKRLELVQNHTSPPDGGCNQRAHVSCHIAVLYYTISLYDWLSIRPERKLDAMSPTFYLRQLRSFTYEIEITASCVLVRKDNRLSGVMCTRLVTLIGQSQSSSGQIAAIKFITSCERAVAVITSELMPTVAFPAWRRVNTRVSSVLQSIPLSDIYPHSSSSIRHTVSSGLLDQGIITSLSLCLRLLLQLPMQYIWGLHLQWNMGSKVPRMLLILDITNVAEWKLA